MTPASRPSGRHLLLLLALILPLTVGGTAQEPPSAPAPEAAPPASTPPAGEFGERLEVSEVFVDVLATDRRGNAVAGLGPADFVVRENGQPVEITSVTYYTSRYADLPLAGEPLAREGAAAAPTLVPASRYFLFFFHDQTGTVDNPSALTRNRLQAARYAKQWVQEDMQGSDWIAVARYDTDLTLHLDLSQDREAIAAAIDEAVIGRASAAMRPSERRRTAAAGGPSLFQGLPDSFQMSDASERPYDAIRMLAEASGHVIGRKNLLLFSLGFGQLESQFRTPDPRYYPAMEEALNANNVAIYPIDLAGGSANTPQTSFLSRLAEDTGGELFKTFVSYATPLARISEQTTGYYLITFRSEHPAGETGYREIDVDAVPKGVRVRARNGYRYGG